MYGRIAIQPFTLKLKRKQKLNDTECTRAQATKHTSEGIHPAYETQDICH